MARRKNAEERGTKAKIKQKKKNEVIVTPRLRLEPRFTPSPSTKRNNLYKKSEKDAMRFEGTRLVGSTSLQNSYSEEESNLLSSCKEQQRNETFAAVSSFVTEENMSNVIVSNEIQSPSKVHKIRKKNTRTTKIRRIKKMGIIYKGFDWSDRERMDLAFGLQAHGFSDLKKLAELVKTKSENDIQQFLKARRSDASFKSGVKMSNYQGNRWNTLNAEYLATWPNIRKWRKLAYEQMLLYTRSKDYSKPVISALCKKFYEEEKEPADDQVINVKLIYKYMMDCMAGEIPPQLPPKESALVLDLLREVRVMPIAYDFEEERKFLQDFRAATKFKPFHVKDEFKKRCRKEPEEMFTHNTISVPEEVFLDLSRHKRLTQSFSPLVTPVWMLQKEQELLEKHAAESNVYVD